MNKIGSRTKGAILCCIIAILIIPAMYLSSNMIREELAVNIKQTLDEISAQNVNSIQSKFEDDFLILEQISDRVRSDDSFKSVMEGMAHAADTYGFKRMGIVDAGGITHASDGAALNVASEDHIVRAYAGERAISDIFFDDADGKRIFAFAVPVFNQSGDRVDSVMFATCDAENVRSHLAVSAFAGQEYCYVVKADGTTVIGSTHESAYPNMDNALDAMNRVGDNAAVAEQMREDMAMGRKGCLMFQNNGDTRYINYEPLSVNDWYLLSVVSAKVMDGTRLNIMMVVYSMFAIMAVTAILFVLTIIKSEKSKQKELKQILYVDDLTGGISFTKFCIDANELLAKHQDKAGKIACIMADLENFRLINNLYGKAEGDKTIINSHKALKRVLDEDELLTRLTGDKFYALLQFEDRAELDEKLDRIVRELKSSGGSLENDYIIDPSIGVYIVESPNETIETITNNATIAHDSLKGRGEQVVIYDESQRDRLRANKKLENQMELAHKNHEFIPYFQPKYSADTGRICGAEALVRWRSADGSITPPGKFISVAESNGFIRVLDRDIFNAVCEFQRKILDSGGECVPISVNVSRQLMYEQNFTSDYIDTLKRHQLSPELVELEITESVLFDDYGVFRSIINTLRENGFKILMDDFGTGYSSLMMLSSVPIDNLKLDKSFIDNMEEEKGRKIIISVIELAKSLDLPLTAEGVETGEQFDFLKRRGCDVIQGYYFSKPVPEDVFLEMIAAGK